MVGIPREDSELTAQLKSLVAQDKLEPLCLGLCKLFKTVYVVTFKVTLKKICAKFPGQFPFGILREDTDVTEFTSESKSLVAQEKLEPFCLGLCKLTYKLFWLSAWPACQLVPPFGR